MTHARFIAGRAPVFMALFAAIAGPPDSAAPDFWKSLQFPEARAGWKFSGLSLFEDFQRELQLFAANDGTQVELPELAREPQAGPALIEVDEELQTHCSPEVGQRDIGADRL